MGFFSISEIFLVADSFATEHPRIKAIRGLLRTLESYLLLTHDIISSVLSAAFLHRKLTIFLMCRILIDKCQSNGRYLAADFACSVCTQFQVKNSEEFHYVSGKNSTDDSEPSTGGRVV